MDYYWIAVVDHDHEVADPFPLRVKAPDIETARVRAQALLDKRLKDYNEDYNERIVCIAREEWTSIP